MPVDRERRGVDQHLPLRRVEFHILLSLAASERHGYGIIQDIEARGETTVPDVGTMYRALARMVENRLIEAVARRSSPEADDERRNYYRITQAGLRVARAEARRLEALTRAARLGGLLAKETK
jgi:DNA-binding PadR family transcriptional regulator